MSKRMSIVGVVLAGIMFWAPSASGQPLLAIVNNNQLALVDPATRQTTGILNGVSRGGEVVGQEVRVVVTPDGLFAYATLPNLDKVVKIDLTTRTVAEVTNPNGSNPFQEPSGIAIAPGKRRAYITDYVMEAIYTIDLTTNTVSSETRLTSAPSDIAVSPDEKTAYVTANPIDNSGLDVIGQLNLDTGALLVPVQKLNSNVDHRIVVTPDGEWVIVKDRDQLFEWGLAGRFAGAKRTIRIDGIEEFDSLVVSSDSRDLYAGGAYGQVARVDVRSGNVVTAKRLTNTRNGDENPLTLAMTLDGQTIYARMDNDIVALDRNLNLKPGDPIVQGVQPFPVVLASIPAFSDNVYFLGDSVTAGFGYCGGADVGRVRNCGVNNPFDNAWSQALSPVSFYSLSACAPPEPVDDRCSNNNVSGGPPWSAPAWSAGNGAPTVAYSFVIAARQSPVNPAQVRNWAMTGSTPADWDPGDDWLGTQAGLFGNQLKPIRNSFVVMTLGANPLLDAYLNITLLATSIRKGACADDTLITRSGNQFAATLDNFTAGPNQPKGVSACLDEKWQEFRQEAHLRAVYRALLAQGNRVLVVGYPPVCPWSFGSWQPAPNLVPGIGGPASGNRCDQQVRTSALPGSNQMISQADQAFYLGDEANDKIRNIVTSLHSPNIGFVAQPESWKDHEAWTDTAQNPSWVFLNDTWIHPSVAGHQQLATSVMAAMCQLFRRWCPGGDGNVHWILP